MTVINNIILKFKTVNFIKHKIYDELAYYVHSHNDLFQQL